MQWTLTKFWYKVFKLCVSILVLLLVLLPVFVFVGLPLFVYRKICQLWIFLWGLDVILAPLGMDSYQGTGQQMEIRLLMQFDSQFKIHEFVQRIEKNLPLRLKYTANTFWRLPAFSKTNQDDFDIKNHVHQIPSLKSDGFQKQVEKIATDLEPLSKTRPQWEFIVLADENKIRTAVIFRIDHAFIDILGVYVFLASLNDQKSPVEFYFDPLDKKIETSQPHWIFIGWGFIMSLPWSLMMAGNRKYRHRNANPQTINTNSFEIDLDKIRAIKKAKSSRVNHILTAAVSKSWTEITKRPKFPFAFTTTKFGRNPKEPRNFSNLCLLTANKCKTLESPRDKIEVIEKDCEEAKYTTIFLQFLAFIAGCLIQSSGSFDHPPCEIFVCTNSPFTKERIQIGGSQMENFYWFLRVNQAYINFVTYDEKMTCCISSAASLLSAEEINGLSTGIQTEIENMYTNSLDSKV